MQCGLFRYMLRLRATWTWTAACPLKRRQIRRRKDKNQLPPSPVHLYHASFYSTFSRTNRQRRRAESVDFIRHDVNVDPCRIRTNARTRGQSVKSRVEKKEERVESGVISYLQTCEVSTDTFMEVEDTRRLCITFVVNLFKALLDARHIDELLYTFFQESLISENPRYLIYRGKYGARRHVMFNEHIQLIIYLYTFDNCL